MNSLQTSVMEVETADGITTMFDWTQAAFGTGSRARSDNNSGARNHRSWPVAGTAEALWSLHSSSSSFLRIDRCQIRLGFGVAQYGQSRDEHRLAARVLHSISMSSSTTRPLPAPSPCSQGVARCARPRESLEPDAIRSRPVFRDAAASSTRREVAISVSQPQRNITAENIRRLA